MAKINLDDAVEAYERGRFHDCGPRGDLVGSPIESACCIGCGEAFGRPGQEARAERESTEAARVARAESARDVGMLARLLGVKLAD